MYFHPSPFESIMVMVRMVEVKLVRVHKKSVAAVKIVLLKPISH